jgi:hypothetical protein
MQELAMQALSRPVGHLFLLGAALLLGLVAVGCATSHESVDPRELNDMFEPVCRGEAISEAAAYPGDGTPHMIGVANDAGGPDYTGVSDEWSATSVEEVQVVACFHITEDVLGVCNYRGGQWGDAQLERIRYTIIVTLREARTAEPIDATSIEGDLPKPCPSTFSSPAPMLSSAPWEQFGDWLSGVAQLRSARRSAA